MTGVERNILAVDKEGSRKGRGRPRSFDRAAAVAAALELFRVRGYAGVSVADLTEAVGIAPPSLYAAFGSKAGLFDEVVALYVAEGGTRMTGSDPDGSGAGAWTRRFLVDAVDALLVRGVPCMVSTGMPHGGDAEGGVSAILVARRSAILAGVAAVIRRWLPEERATAVARFVVATMQGLSLQVGDGASREELLAVIHLAVAAVDGEADGTTTR